MISITANNINKKFSQNNIKALDNFSLDIPKGAIFGLLGPNGAGKSTFINILAGLVKRDTGEIYINELNLDNNVKVCRKKIGIVPQI